MYIGQLDAPRTTQFLSAMTGGGVYRIYGVAGDTQVRVTKREYDLEVQLIDVNEHRTLDFELKRSR